MKVLVDTSVWSLALRRREADLTVEQAAIRDELTDLIGDNRVEIVGVIRQELLSGVKDRATFEKLRRRLRDFQDAPTVTEDHETAAEAHNLCRAKGVAGSAIDFLLCAVAARRGIPIFTTDGDFVRYATVLPISLHAATRGQPGTARGSRRQGRGRGPCATPGRRPSLDRETSVPDCRAPAHAR